MYKNTTQKNNRRTQIQLKSNRKRLHELTQKLIEKHSILLGNTSIYGVRGSAGVHERKRLHRCELRITKRKAMIEKSYS